MITKKEAYLLGVFLGDGSVDIHKRTFTLQAIDKDFVEKTAEALRSMTKNKVSEATQNRLTVANNKVYATYLSDVVFCKSISEKTNNRKSIPIDFYKWESGHQKELVSGLLDSDGYVSVSKAHIYNGQEVFNMTIGIGACDIWLYELYFFLKKEGVQVGSINREKLKSGKMFAKFIFNKKSFIEKGFYFNLKRKQDRIEKYKILFPGSTTNRCIPDTKETRVKKSESLKGRIFSTCTKKKMSLSAKKRKKIRDEKGRFISVR